MDRRDFVRLLGGSVAATLPLNFGCDSEQIVTNSGFVASPERPYTPNTHFYVNVCCGVPDVRPTATWKLRVQGLVDRELSLSFADLSAFETIELGVTLECVGNSPGGQLISSALFTGVRMQDVLAEAGVQSAARGLACIGLDGFRSVVPAQIADDPDPLLVWAMNGEPLAPVHGAPVRVLYPKRYGLFSVKWLDSITATREYANYGVFRGISPNVLGDKPTRSRIDRPADGQLAKAGEPLTVTGLAVSNHGVARVEVFADDRWQPASVDFNTLTDEHSPYLWSLWRFEWTPPRPGRHILRVRAFTPDGSTQSADADFPYDSGAIHTVRVVAT